MPWGFAGSTMACSETAAAPPDRRAGLRKNRQVIPRPPPHPPKRPVFAPLSAISLSEKACAFISMAQWRGPNDVSHGPRDLLRHLSACNHITNRLKEAGPVHPECRI